MTVQFLRSYSTFSTGQKATFSGDTEASLVQQGIASFVGPAAKANQPFESVENPSFYNDINLYAAQYNLARTGQLNPYFVDMIGDSRTADAAVSPPSPTNPRGAGRHGVHWFNWANALTGDRMTVNLNLGISGGRQDQYLAGLNSAGNPVGAAPGVGLSAALASPAAVLIFGYPIVNDLAAAIAGNYVATDGVAVTIANVAATCAARAQAAALSAIAVGKLVVISAEPGATNLNSAAVGQLHEFNLRMRCFCEYTPGVIWFDPTDVLWNPTASTTLIGFKTGMLRTVGSDPVHYSVLGGRTAGQAFANLLSARGISPAISGPKTLNDSAAVNPSQLIGNPLLNTLTGGASSGGVAVTGNIPANVTIKGAATSSVTVSSAANAGGFGNDITLAATASAADSVRFEFNAPSLAAWEITDILESYIEVDVVAGSSNACAFADNNISDSGGGLDHWMMYGLGFGPFPTDAYSMKLRGISFPRVGAGTKSFTTLAFWMRFDAAGSMTATIRRPSFLKRF